MTPETFALGDELLAWLDFDEHTVPDWAPDPPRAELQCSPELVARLTEVARPVAGTRRAWVDGCPVVHHPSGVPIAFAGGESYLAVRSAQAAGALASRWHARELGDSWVDLDPFAPDVGLVHTVELLRGHVQRAYDRAEAGAWR